MQTGKVVRIMDKGFGFIQQDGQEKDLFFHRSEFQGNFEELQVGDQVTFDITEGQDRPAATNVKRA